MVIAHGSEAGCGDDHHLSFALDGLRGDIAERLHDDCSLLANHVGMELLVLAEQLHGRRCGNVRVVRNGLSNLDRLLICHVMIQRVQDETLLNRLAHRIDVERPE